MARLVGRVVGAVTLALGVSPADTWAQHHSGAAGQPRWHVEAAAGIQVHYDGSVQSLAVGFAPDRSLTVLVRAERSHIADRIDTYPDGYASERGGTEQFLSGEVRYAFLARRRMSPYVLGGIGRGTSRPNVSTYFPDKKERSVHVVYYGGGVRLPVGPQFDAFADVRLIMSMEGRSDYFGVRMPVRAGMAWRF